MLWRNWRPKGKKSIYLNIKRITFGQLSDLKMIKFPILAWSHIVVLLLIPKERKTYGILKLRAYCFLHHLTVYVNTYSWNWTEIHLIKWREKSEQFPSGSFYQAESQGSLLRKQKQKQTPLITKCWFINLTFPCLLFFSILILEIY